MHIYDMDKRSQTAIVFVASGYFGLFMLCIVLLHLAGPPNAGILQFDVAANRYDPGFVDTIAAMLDLQISMYVLRGLIANGAIFAALFACLSAVFYKLQLFDNLADNSVNWLTKVMTWKRTVSYVVFPSFFCAIAIANAYFCHPVGLFVFARWLVVEVPLLQYFFAGLLLVVMARLLNGLAKGDYTSLAKFAAVTCTVYLLFFILAALWPDMGSPLAVFSLSCVKNVSETYTFGTPGGHSFLPASPIIWDAILIAFMLFATGATLLGSCQLLAGSAKLDGRFCATRMLTLKFASAAIISLAICSTDWAVIKNLLIFVPNIPS